MATSRLIRRSLVLSVLAGAVALMWWLWQDSPQNPESKAEEAVPEAPGDTPTHEPGRLPAIAARRAAPDGQLHGLVLTAEGEPVAGADISVVASGALLPIRSGIRSDESGRFQLSELIDGLYSVTAVKDGLISERVSAAVRSATVTEVNLVVEQGASLSGTVRDASDGSSLASCSVTGPSGVVPCDHGGRFVLGPLVPGTVPFRVSAPGYAPREVAVSLTKRAKVTADVVLTRGGVVTGTVFDPDHRPFAGARVRTSHYALEGARPAEVETTSDKEGRFTLDGIAPGRVRLHAAAQGYAETPGAELLLAGGEQKEGVELTLKTGGAIAGTVTDASGKSVEGAQLQAMRLSDKSVAASDVSAADGSFRLDGVAPGDYTVVASTTWARGVTPNVNVNGREEATVNVILGDDSIEGTVRTESGQPVPNAAVAVFSSHSAGLGAVNAVTDGEGRFRAEGLLGAPYRVQARAEGYGSDEVRGIAAGARAELVLTGSGSIEGTVTSSNGRGLESFELRLVPKEGGRPGGVAGRYRVLHLVSPDGRFRIDDVPAGKYVVRAASPGYVDSERPTDVAAGSVAQVTLSLGDGATVSGHIRHVDGAPAVGCDVHPSSEPVVTDQAGTFKLTGLDRKDGFVFVWARCENNTLASGRVTLDADGRGEIVLQAKPAKNGNFNRMNADFGGVGMSLRENDGHLYATSVFEGGPAFLAGIQDGDEIVSVDGWLTAGASIQDVVSRIRGPLGMPVSIGVMRRGTTFQAYPERARIALD